MFAYSIKIFTPSKNCWALQDSVSHIATCIRCGPTSKANHNGTLFSAVGINRPPDVADYRNKLQRAYYYLVTSGIISHSKNFGDSRCQTCVVDTKHKC